jgi:CRP-like cAMP-binding protein
VEPDQRADALFIVHSGAVEVRGFATHPVRLGAGEMFGEAALILGEPYRLRAVALSESELVTVGLEDLQQLCLDSPDFTFRLIRHLSQRLRMRTTHDEVEGRQLASRLAAVILDLASDGEGPVRVEGRLIELAQAANVPIREAYLWIQRWLEQRMLRLADDQLSLVEPEALRAVAEPPSEAA